MILKKVKMLKTEDSTMWVELRLVEGKGGILTFIIVLVGAYYGVDLTGLMGGGVEYEEQTSALNESEEKQLRTLSAKVLTTAKYLDFLLPAKWSQLIKSRLWCFTVGQFKLPVAPVNLQWVAFYCLSIKNMFRFIIL